MAQDLDRRDFLKHGATAAAALALGAAAVSSATASPLTSPPPEPIMAEKLSKVRIGFVGVGGQGTSHVRNMLHVPGAQITAVCDIVEDKVANVQKMVVEKGDPKPKGYASSPVAYKELCQSPDVDLVYNATPWELHAPVCVEAMNNSWLVSRPCWLTIIRPVF